MSQSEYVATEVAIELARNLIRFNGVAVRYAFGHGNRLADAAYFASAGEAKTRLKAVFCDLDIKELWVGATRLHESELMEFISYLRKQYPREHGSLVKADKDSIVETITFA